MCGIVGFFSFQKTPVEKSLLAAMNEQIVHRGPDSDGFFIDSHVGMAMRRLKIIDLSTGNQPIYSEDKQVCIVFNGEIYNYRELRDELVKKGRPFITASDTEVILQSYLEYGDACVHKLIGMFAFAIYDKPKDRIFIARDRLGIKPLFFHQSSQGILFGSELKTLLQAPWVKANLDYQALSHFLSLNYLPPPWTPIEEIKQLLPGYTLTITASGIETKEYWDIPIGPPIEVGEEEACKEILRLMHQSIERRLIADVPIGTYLSGGLDSSAIVWFMKEHRHETIKTFAAGFDHPDYDEAPYARQVADYFGTDHHEVKCTAADVFSLLPKIAWHADGLLADQACLPLYKVSQLANQHVKVCLSGDGGDEIFVGYPTFIADQYHKTYSRIPGFIRHGLIDPVVNLMPASQGKVSFEYKAKKFIQAGDFSSDKAHYWWRTIFTDQEKAKLLNTAAITKISNIDSFTVYEQAFKKAASLDPVSRSLYADMKIWLAGNNLYKVDTMSMAHSLEARVPFLDHELVEYMAKLPPSLKFRGNILKYLMKKILVGKLPETIRVRKKAGFHSPISYWFKNYLGKELCHTLSHEAHHFPEHLFDFREISQLINQHIKGKANHSFKLWGLLIFKHWSSQHKIAYA